MKEPKRIKTEYDYQLSFGINYERTTNHKPLPQAKQLAIENLKTDLNYYTKIIKEISKKIGE